MKSHLSHPPAKHPCIICVPPSTSTLYVREGGFGTDKPRLTLTAVTRSGDRAGCIATKTQNRLMNGTTSMCMQKDN